MTATSRWGTLREIPALSRDSLTCKRYYPLLRRLRFNQQANQNAVPKATASLVALVSKCDRLIQTLSLLLPHS